MICGLLCPVLAQSCVTARSQLLYYLPTLTRKVVATCFKLIHYIWQIHLNTSLAYDMRTIKQVNTLNFAKQKCLHPTLAAKTTSPVHGYHPTRHPSGGETPWRRLCRSCWHWRFGFSPQKGGWKTCSKYMRLERFGNRGTSGRMPENDTQSYYIKWLSSVLCQFYAILSGHESLHYQG